MTTYINPSPFSCTSLTVASATPESSAATARRTFPEGVLLKRTSSITITHGIRAILVICETVGNRRLVCPPLSHIRLKGGGGALGKDHPKRTG
jgi:hypothetical protein